jgi:hypothetical protein
MVAQPPVQINVNGSTPADKLSAALLKDDIFLAIHNAFLLGWSILELKSRIQIAACNPEQIDHTISSQAKSQSQSIETLIKGIVLADLEAITEQDMKNYVNRSLNLPQKALPSELRDQEWLTNILRALFNRIVTLHLYRFPYSNTTHTIYNLQSIRPSLTYLNGDYATIGITPIKDDGSGKGFKADFDLYDTTRRAINCLTLLLTTAEATLIKKTLSDYQKQLVDVIAIATNYTQSGNPAPGGGEQDPRRKQHAIKVLTNLIVQLLDAWDSFLRESYYSDPDSHNTELELTAYESGRSLASLSWNASVILAPLESVFKQGTDVRGNQSAKDTPQNKAQTIAKQALTEKARKTWLNVFNDRDVNYVQYQIMALSTALDEAYYRVNPNIKRTDPNDPTIPPNPDLPSQAIQAVVQSLNYWQRAIIRICKLENDVKPLPIPQQSKPWSGAQSANPPAADSSGAGQTPNEFSQKSAQAQTQTTVQAGAITRTLKGFTRTLKDFFVNRGLLPRENPPLPQRTLPPSDYLNWDMSIELRNELVQQSYIWQSLILCQQSLQSFSVEKVTQKILNEFMSDLERAVRNELRRTTSLWVVFVLVILAILGFLVIAASHTSNPIQTLFNNPLVYLTALGVAIAPFVNAINSRFAQIGNALGSRFGAAGTAVEQGLQRGYDQVLTEFNYLNHNIGITYPLVEFFLWEEIDFGGNAVKDGYDFLVHVFWTSDDREQELMRVARAAFGPIGAFIGAKLSTSTSSSGTQRRAVAARSSNNPQSQLARQQEQPQRAPAGSTQAAQVKQSGKK